MRFVNSFEVKKSKNFRDKGECEKRRLKSEKKEKKYKGKYNIKEKYILTEKCREAASGDAERERESGERGGKHAGAGRAGSGGSAGRKVQERTGKSGESGKKRKRRRGKAGKGTGRKSARGRNRNGGAEGKYAEGKYAEGRGDLRVGNTLRAKKSRNPGKKGKENKFSLFRG